MAEPPDLRRLIGLVIAEDPAAADEVERLGRQLLDLAARLRASYQSDPYLSESGIGDRVLMQVVGPDGQVRQRTDTGGS